MTTTFRSAPFAALTASVFSTLYGHTLAKTVETWDNTASQITRARFPFTGTPLVEEDAEYVRATASFAAYDAIHAVLGEGDGQFYDTPSAATTPLGAEAAVAQAAHDVLAAYFTHPLNLAELKLRLARRLAALPDGQEKIDGRTTGAAAASAALAARSPRLAKKRAA